MSNTGRAVCASEQTTVRRVAALLLLAAFGAAAYFGFQQTPQTNEARVASAGEGDGEALFDANCARCHGKRAVGTENGPPLVHIIYEPGHHADFSFQRAVQLGVRQHHWRFGKMPAIPDLSKEKVSEITAYVRRLQRDAGIF